MTDPAAERRREVAALIRVTRAILDEVPPDRISLDRVRSRILSLAARKELWSEAEFPAPEGEERQSRYLIGQEGPEGISLYLNVMQGGKRIPPHNHTTWACIAAVEGVEHNTLYDRLDDGSVPGKAEIRPRETVAVEPGNAIAMLADDVHSVETRGGGVIRHLHFYGRPLETLDRRLAFDMEKGTCQVMRMAVKTRA